MVEEKTTNQPAATNPPTTPAAAPVPSANNTETTVSKDSDLAINQTAPAAPAPTAPAVEPPAPIAESGAVTAQTTPAAPPLSPVMVSEAEAKAVDNATPPVPANPADTAEVTEALGDQIEILSGEIKTLESKIENLGKSAPGAALEPPPVVLPMTSVESTPAPVSVPEPVVPSTETPHAETPEAPKAKETDAPKPTMTPTPTGLKTNNGAVTFNDIFTKQAADLKSEKEAPNKTVPLNDEKPAKPSSLGEIGEVLSVIGIILFAVLLAGPFYQSFLDPSIYASLMSSGALVVLILTGLGFLLSLFSKGKWGLKIITLIFVLLAGVFYWGLIAQSSVAASALSSILGYYR